MEVKKTKEYQTTRLFATLALLTLMLVLLFKVVLFGPQDHDKNRLPAGRADPTFSDSFLESEK